MPVMNVTIVVADDNSADNKRLLEFLHANVAEFKRFLQMNIETVPKAQKGLPYAQIGSRPAVTGVKAIMTALNESYATASTLVSKDEVESYQETSIMKGIEEDKSSFGGADPDMRAQQFTQAIANRSRGTKPATGRMPPNAMRLKPAAAERSTSAPTIKGGPRPTMATGMTPGSAIAAGFKEVDDGLENDPQMKQFWANMQETPM